MPGAMMSYNTTTASLLTDEWPLGADPNDPQVTPDLGEKTLTWQTDDGSPAGGQDNSNEVDFLLNKDVNYGGDGGGFYTAADGTQSAVGTVFSSAAIFTSVVWIKTQGLPVQSSYIIYDGTPGTDGWGIRVGGGDLSAAGTNVGIELGGKSINALAATHGFNVGAGADSKVMLGVTRDGTTLKLYFFCGGATTPGVLVGSTTTALNTPTGNFRIAGDGNGHDFNGGIQYAGFNSNTALSPAQLQSIYDAGALPVPPSIAIAPAAASNPAAGATVNISVLGAVAAGESTLSYTWSGSGEVTFSPNGNNAAKNSSMTFASPGTYTITATVSDPYGQTAAAGFAEIVPVTAFFGSAITAVGQVGGGSLTLDFNPTLGYTVANNTIFNITMPTVTAWASQVGSNSLGALDVHHLPPSFQMGSAQNSCLAFEDHNPSSDADALNFTSGLPAFDYRAATLIAVLQPKQTDGSGRDIFVTADAGNGSDAGLHISANRTTQFGDGVTITDGGIRLPCSKSIVAAVCGSSSLRLVVNGLSSKKTAARSFTGSMSGFGYWGFPGFFKLYRGLFYNSALSNSDLWSLVSYLAGVYGISLNPTSFFAVDGDSIETGRMSTGCNNWPGQSRLLNAPGSVFYNCGVAGQSMATMLSNFNSVMKPLVALGCKTLIFGGGRNDMYLGVAGSGAALYTTFTNYVAAARSAGFASLVHVTPGAISTGTNYEVQRAIYLAALYASPLGVKLADVASDPLLGQVGAGNNPLYFASDNEHYTSQGYARLAAIVDAALAPTGAAGSKFLTKWAA